MEGSRELRESILEETIVEKMMWIDERV